VPARRQLGRVADPHTEHEAPGNASASALAPATIAIGSRTQMFAIPLATTIRRVAASSRAPWLSDSLPLWASLYQRAP
jgi:hypothetical protein